MVDPFMGSGTFIVAAKKYGISAVGCDRIEAYCEDAAKRLEQECLVFEGNKIQERQAEYSAAVKASNKRFGKYLNETYPGRKTN